MRKVRSGAKKPHGQDDHAYEPADYAIKALKASERDMKAGRVSPAFDNAKDAIAWLHSNTIKYNKTSKK